MIVWKDITSYSRNRTGERIPDTWSAAIGPVRLVVCSSHIYYKGKWIANAHPCFTERVLKATTLEEAQREALQHLRDWLALVVAALPEPHTEGGDG